MSDTTRANGVARLSYPGRARLAATLMPHGKPVNVRQVAAYLTERQIERLNELKKRVGVPVAESIRRAVDEYLTQLQKKEKRK